MDIDADSVSAFLTDEDATLLKGNVVVVQGSLKIRADQAVLHFKSGDMTDAVFTGSPVKIDQLLDDGTPVSSTASSAHYTLGANSVVLTGDVFIKKPTDTLEGEQVVYDLGNGKMNAQGEKGSRVKLHIEPKVRRASR